MLGAKAGGRERVAWMPPTTVHSLVQNVEEAVVSVYRRNAEARVNVPRAAPAPVDALQEAEVMRAPVEEPEASIHVTEEVAVDEGDDKREALTVEPCPSFNWIGRRDEAVICPRKWIIYSQRPQHIVQLTWTAVAPHPSSYA
jgi:hypothetical protein